MQYVQCKYAVTVPRQRSTIASGTDAAKKSIKNAQIYRYVAAAVSGCFPKELNAATPFCLL